MRHPSVCLTSRANKTLRYVPGAGVTAASREQCVNDRVALITGGARGIGRAVGIDLAKQGWAVAFCYRTSVDDALRTKAAIESQGAAALAIQADVSEVTAAERLVAEVSDAWGRIDALINCAGPYHRVNILEETPEGWRSMFANNLDAVFYVSRAAIPGMIERKWGRIVNFGIATAERLAAQPGLTAHYIAKAGVLVLTRTLARTLAPHGITVNAISPGYIDSGGTPVEELQALVKRIPAGYVGDPEDAANVVRFLLSEDARYVNGANITVSGGWGV